MPFRNYLAAVAFGIAALAGVETAVVAQNLPPAPSPFGPAPHKPPLFAPPAPASPELERRQRELQARAALLAAQLARQPKIECGMRIIPADPRVDQKAVKPAPESPKGTIRQVPPAACR